VTIRPTRGAVLALLLLISLVTGWGVTRVIEGYGGNLPDLPWTTPALLALLTLGLGIIAWDLRRRLERPGQEKDRPQRPKEVNPLHAARMVVLSKAASHGGAIMTGLYLGFAWYLAPDIDSQQRRSRLIVAAISALFALGTTVIGLVMERMLRLPDE
jgi:drug/metabolite transporter (DMT)-like permease